MDNLTVHKAAEGDAALSALCLTALHLPPYSPNFNSIERMFGKVKSKLSTLPARTAETLAAAGRSRRHRVGRCDDQQPKTA